MEKGKIKNIIILVLVIVNLFLLVLVTMDRVSSARLRRRNLQTLYQVVELHGIGIVHADIKPDNILLTRTASQSITAKIIDIDSSFFEGEPPEEITGDQVYFAPETALYMLGLADDIQPNRKIDVFALGLIFHQILTGIPVSFPPGYHYAFEACLDDKPLSLSPQLPEAFRPILLGMLATEPDQRSSTEDVFLQLKQQYMELVNAAGSPVRPVRPAPSAASAAPSSAGDLRLKINGLHASGAFDAINTRSSFGAPPAPAAPSAEDNDPFFLPGSL